MTLTELKTLIESHGLCPIQDADEEKELVRLVRNLINNSEFVRMPTQRGMKEYALEMHPELSEMDDASLSREIQFLSDKIKAKGLNKKKH